MAETIQSLLLQVNTASVRSYLSQRGWDVESHFESGTVRFVRPAGESHEEYRLFLPSEATAGFRRRLQHVVFSLSVIEDRPAMEVLRELASMDSLNHQPAAQQTRSRMHLVNSQSHPIKVVVGPVPFEFTLMPSESLIFVAEPSSTPKTDVREDCWSIHFGRGDYSIWHLFSAGVSTADLEIANIVATELRDVAAQSGAGRPNLLRTDLEAVLRRAESEAASRPSRDEWGIAAVRRQASVMCAGLARCLPDDPLGHQFVWRVCGRILGKVDLGLAVGPSTLKTFFQLGRMDEEDSPSNVLRWINENSG